METEGMTEQSNEVIADLREQLKRLEDRLAAIDPSHGIAAAERGDPQLAAPTEASTDELGEDPALRPWAEELTNANTIPEVRECNFMDFKNRFSKNDGRYAVDVLVSGGLLEKEIREERNFRKRRFEAARLSSATARNRTIARIRAANVANNDHIRKAQLGDTWIRCIRVQAPALLKILARVQGEGWSTRPRVYHRPFNSLIYFHDKMKKELEDLEKRWGGGRGSDAGGSGGGIGEGSRGSGTPAVMSTVDDNGSDGGGCADSGNSDNCSAALAILQAYMQFMDDKVIPEYTQFDELDRSSDAKIRFSDLWFLFRTGDLVYRPMGDDIRRQLDDASGSGRRMGTGKMVLRAFGIDPSDTNQLQSTPTDHRRFDGTDDERRTSFVVRAFYLDYTGDEFGVVIKNLMIEPFKGKKLVTSLPVFPVRFAPDHTRLLRTVERLGRKTIQYIECKHGSYNGWTIMRCPNGDPATEESGALTKHPDHLNSEVMVDFNEAFQVNPNWKPKRTILRPRPVHQSVEPDEFAVYWWSGPDRARLLGEATELVPIRTGVSRWRQNEYVLEDPLLAAMSDNDRHGRLTTKKYLRPEDIALVTNRVYAYVFQERKFAQLDVKRLSPSTGDRNALDSLRIPEGIKDLLQRSVQGHFLQKEAEECMGEGSMSLDPIRGKGSGLFILLHGAPGVGKTATAEAVAQANGKPLFKITSGDLGLAPDQVESQLRSIFRLAALWDCILLMDEVDTFFSHRSKGDGALHKNALVSVFLQVLEYYSGILFLTTNRPGALDPAFTSRIQVAINYEPLTQRETLEIWKLNLDRLAMIEEAQSRRELRPPMCIPEREILDHADKMFRYCKTKHLLPWNGRQIRNAVQVARWLAYADAAAAAAERSAGGGGSLEEGREEAGEEGRGEGAATAAAGAVAVSPYLRVDYFKQMQAITDEFQRYIKSVFAGMDVQGLLLEREERNEKYVQQNIWEHDPPGTRPQEERYGNEYEGEQHRPGPTFRFTGVQNPFQGPPAAATRPRSGGHRGGARSAVAFGVPDPYMFQGSSSTTVPGGSDDRLGLAPGGGGNGWQEPGQRQQQQQPPGPHTLRSDTFTQPYRSPGMRRGGPPSTELSPSSTAARAYIAGYGQQQQRQQPSPRLLAAEASPRNVSTGAESSGYPAIVSASPREAAASRLYPSARREYPFVRYGEMEADEEEYGSVKNEFGKRERESVGVDMEDPYSRKDAYLRRYLPSR